MNIGEFKAWFDGYLESCKDTPKRQVERIKEKLGEAMNPSPWAFTTTNIPHIYTDNDTSLLNVQDTTDNITLGEN